MHGRDGTRLPAPPIPGTWAVNAAEMVSRWPNGRWQSTPHRTKNVAGGDRLSRRCFFDMAMDAVVTVLPTCQGPDNPSRFAPVRYSAYLIARLNRSDAYRRRQGA